MSLILACLKFLILDILLNFIKILSKHMTEMYY